MFLLLSLSLLLSATASAQAQPTKGTDLCTVEGLVVQDPGSKPIRKVDITLTGLADGEEEGSNYAALTDAEGRFKIEEIKPGNYHLSWRRTGFLNAGKRRGSRLSLSLEPGQQIKDLVIHMQQAAVITGKILDEDGDPQPHVRVHASPYRSAAQQGGFEWAGFGSTNDLGEFRIAGLLPGKYLVIASPPFQARRALQMKNSPGKEDMSLATTFYPGTADKGQAVSLEVHTGEEVPVSFSLASVHAFHVRGTVDLSGLGGEVGVMLRSKNRAIDALDLGMTEIQKDGSFDIRGVLPGSYRAMLFVASGITPQTISTGRTIEVTDADVEAVRLTPMPSGNVRGRFRMEGTSRPDWSKLTVNLDADDEDISMDRWISDETFTYAQVKSDGSFELKNVPAGTYHLLIQSSDRKLRDYFSKSINLGGKDVGDTGFTVSGGNYSLDVVVSAEGAAIEGTVVDGKDQPIADATVVAIPDAKRRGRRDVYQQNTTDQRGHFSLRGLNPGEYTVLAFEDLEDDYRDPDFIKTYEGRGETVKLDEGSHKSVLLKVIPAAEEEQ